MKSAKWFEEMMESVRTDFIFRLETIILEITEQVVEAMQKNGINRTKLAHLLNVSPAFVSKILNGTSNFTLKTLLSLADALNLEFKVEFKTRSPRENYQIPRVTSTTGVFSISDFQDTGFLRSDSTAADFPKPYTSKRTTRGNQVYQDTVVA